MLNAFLIVVAVAVFILFIAAMCAPEGELARYAGWEEKWPPISDDEFMARCPPGTSRDVALRVRRIVAEQLGVSYERVYPEQNFVNDLDCC